MRRGMRAGLRDDGVLVAEISLAKPLGGKFASFVQFEVESGSGKIDRLG
jgi:hypothetical protein